MKNYFSFNLENLIKKISGLIEANKGTVESVEKVGVKKYAYKINYTTEGYYVLMNVECNANVPNLITKQLHLIEDVVRSMFVKKDA